MMEGSNGLKNLHDNVKKKILLVDLQLIAILRWSIREEGNGRFYGNSDEPYRGGF